MRGSFLGWLACASLALAGCNPMDRIRQTPAVTASADLCKFTRYNIDVPFPDEAGEVGSTKAGSYAALMRDTFLKQPGDYLLLSGGSQHGAFGAGFLDEWAKDGGLPQFRVVTGVSTGALQSTGAFIGRTDIAVDGYTIEEEGDILQPFVTSAQLNARVPLKAGWRILSRGGMADLIPLREVLDATLTDDVLAEVARRGTEEQAKLLVAATDLDSGQAVVFDMTEMAQRITESSGSERDKLRACYVEALVASSIVPPGALPVFLDNRMYIDGGAKFAVFIEELRRMLGDDQLVKSIAGEKDPLHNVYILLNGTGEIQRQCGKVDETLCHPDRPDTQLVGAHKQWHLPGVAFRTLDLLINQVTRLSIARAVSLAEGSGKQPYFIRIREDERDAFVAEAGAPFEEGKRSCAQWRALDRAIDEPLEFHPRYMRCLIAYGRSVARASDWPKAHAE